MHHLVLAFFLVSSPLLAAPKTLLSFEKGEVTPGLAKAVEKIGAGAYKLTIPNKPGWPKLDKIKLRLEKELKNFPGINITSQNESIIIAFQGPDTPLLQALSHIEIQP